MEDEQCPISMFDAKSDFRMIQMDSATHMKEFAAYLVWKGKSKSTADQYAALVKSMISRGDIRDDETFNMVLANFNPNTRSGRITARNAWMEYIGASLEQIRAPAYQLPRGLPTLSARRGKILRGLDALLIQWIELEQSGVEMPDLEKEIQEGYAKAMRVYERRVPIAKLKTGDLKPDKPNEPTATAPRKKPVDVNDMLSKLRDYVAEDETEEADLLDDGDSDEDGEPEE